MKLTSGFCRVGAWARSSAAPRPTGRKATWHYDCAVAEATPEPTASEDEPSELQRIEKAVKGLFHESEVDGEEADEQPFDDAW
jgi:hypothetical protein